MSLLQKVDFGVLCACLNWQKLLKVSGLAAVAPAAIALFTDDRSLAVVHCLTSYFVLLDSLA